MVKMTLIKSKYRKKSSNIIISQEIRQLVFKDLENKCRGKRLGIPNKKKRLFSPSNPSYSEIQWPVQWGKRYALLAISPSI